MILQCYFRGKAQGFYIDIGAHHPLKYSNTYFFYRRGWRGVSVDATPGSMQKFLIDRPRDVNIEAAVSSNFGTLPFFLFENPAYNALNPSSDEIAEIERGTKLVNVVSVQTIPLLEVFKQYAPKSAPIDFLNMDIEGHELAALSTNDWDRFRPTMIVAEDLGAFDVASLLDRPLAQYLHSVGYALCGKCHHTIIFVEKSRYCRDGLLSST